MYTHQKIDVYVHWNWGNQGIQCITVKHVCVYIYTPKNRCICTLKLRQPGDPVHNSETYMCVYTPKKKTQFFQLPECPHKVSTHPNLTLGKLREELATDTLLTDLTGLPKTLVKYPTGHPETSGNKDIVQCTWTRDFRRSHRERYCWAHNPDANSRYPSHAMDLCQCCRFIRNFAQVTPETILFFLSKHICLLVYILYVIIQPYAYLARCQQWYRATHQQLCWLGRSWRLADTQRKKWYIFQSEWFLLTEPRYLWWIHLPVRHDHQGKLRGSRSATNSSGNIPAWRSVFFLTEISVKSPWKHLFSLPTKRFCVNVSKNVEKGSTADGSNLESAETSETLLWDFGKCFKRSVNYLHITSMYRDELMHQRCQLLYVGHN